MKGQRVYWTVTGAAALVLASFSVAVSLWRGLAAFALGAEGTALFLGGTWLIVKLVGSTVSPYRPTRAQIFLTVLALLLKLPIVYVGWLLSQRLGPFGPTWFLTGVALVYCAVIWRAVLAVRD